MCQAKYLLVSHATIINMAFRKYRINQKKNIWGKNLSGCNFVQLYNNH